MMDLWRDFNMVMSALGALLVIRFMMRNKGTLVPSETLVMLGLLMLLVTASYGSFEAAHLKTLFRVPMVTIAVLWVVVAAFLPSKHRRGK